MPIITITHIDELIKFENQIRESVVEATRLLRELLEKPDSVEVLSELRFNPVGRDPINGNRPLNFVEQLNQTFSHLVQLKATRYLFKLHADSAPFILCLGPVGGYDIASGDGRVVAEVFAAVSPKSNDKLKRDIAKVFASQAEHKYVFYFCPGYPEGLTEVNGVKTISFPEI